MKIYIAGKITGEDREEVIKKFSRAEEYLKKAENEVFNPTVLPAYSDVPLDDYLHICFAIIDVCDSIYMLSDWQTSIGARKELQYASDWGKTILYETETTREDSFPIVYKR